MKAFKNDTSIEEDTTQKIMEELYNQCKWLDIKLKLSGYDGVVINRMVNDIPMKSYIITNDIVKWFEYRRKEDKIIKPIEKLSTQFYKFEEHILKTHRS